MPKSLSLIYCRFSDEVSDRFSYGENHPEREEFYNFLKSARYEDCELQEIQSIVEFIEEGIEAESQYPNEVILYLGLEDIERNTGKAVFRSYFGRDIHSTSKRLHRGNIVFAGLRPYLNKAHLVEMEEGIGSTELFVIQPHKEQVIPQFLLKYLLSDLVLSQTKWILTGSSYPRLNDSDFKKIRVVLPSKIERQSAILDSIKPLEEEAKKKKDEVGQFRNECRNTILNKLEIRMPLPAIFDSSTWPYFIAWPNHYPERLDLTYHHPWMDEIRNLLRSLRTIKLEDIIEPHIDYGITASGREEGFIPFINIENLRPDGRLSTANIRYIDSAEDTKLVRARDILLSRSRLVGVCSIVTEKEDGFTYGSYILRMRVKQESKIPAEYLVSFLNSDLGQAQIRLLETGSFGKNINTRQLKDIDVVLPTDNDDIYALATQVVMKWSELDALEKQAEMAWSASRNKFTSLLVNVNNF